MFEAQLDLAGHRIEAVSVGGVETCFRVPGFDVCLDIGRSPRGAEREATLLLTHAHIDHAAGLPYYVSLRGLMGAPAPRVFCPAADRDTLWHILETWSTLQADSDRCTLEGVKPGDRIELGKSRFATVFRSPHRIATVGYTLHRRNKRLKEALRGLPNEEIAARARRGEAVQDLIDVPEICFPGDTTIDVVEREPTVRTARLLLLECTFVGDKVSEAWARKSGHIHLDQIAARADLFENEAILLTHFSRRHSPDEIRAQVDATLPESLRPRVTLLV